MPAHVVKRLHRPGLVAEDDDAVAAAVFEHEVVARSGDPILVIGHQPEMVGDEPLVVQVVLFLEVVLRRNRGAFPPPAWMHRGLIGERRLVQHHVAAGRVHATVADFRRQRDTSAAGHRRAFGGGRALRRERLLRRGRTEERRGQRDRRRRGTRGNRRPGKVTTAYFLCSCSLQRWSSESTTNRRIVYFSVFSCFRGGTAHVSMDSCSAMSHSRNPESVCGGIDDEGRS